MRAIVSHPLVLVVFAALTPCASATDIHVPADYSTIQAAIDAALSGDVVLVEPGIYYENIDFKGKAITVQSTEGATVTTIDGGGIDSVVKCLNGETNASVLDGFTLTNGYGYVGYCGCTHLGGGICISERWQVPASPTIRNNRIIGNTAIDGGGVYISKPSAAVLVNNVISGNVATGSGGGICVVNSSTAAPVITNNDVFGNQATSAGHGGGIYVQGGTTTSFENDIVWGNSPEQVIGDGTYSYCNVSGGVSGTGNIDSDPAWVDPSSGDFHLNLSSPCINIGDNSAPDLPTTDFDGESRIIDGIVDIGADEAVPGPIVLAVAPARTKYDTPIGVTITGFGFSAGTGTIVTVAGNSASSVVVVDDQTITCDFSVGTPGTADVTVSNSLGSGTLPAGFAYTPAITIDGTPQLGASITIHYLCDPGDGLFGIYGLPPQVSIPTPPYFGDLCIVPFNVLLVLPTWPFQDFDVQATIPNDPSLSGVQLLLQALIGPSLAKHPKVGAWTNCAVLAIQ